MTVLLEEEEQVDLARATETSDALAADGKDGHDWSVAYLLACIRIAAAMAAARQDPPELAPARAELPRAWTVRRSR